MSEADEAQANNLITEVKFTATRFSDAISVKQQVCRLQPLSGTLQKLILEMQVCQSLAELCAAHVYWGPQLNHTSRFSVFVLISTLLHGLSFRSIRANEEEKDSLQIRYSLSVLPLIFHFSQCQRQTCTCLQCKWLADNSNRIKIEQFRKYSQSEVICKDIIQSSSLLLLRKFLSTLPFPFLPTHIGAMASDLCQLI